MTSKSFRNQGALTRDGYTELWNLFHSIIFHEICGKVPCNLSDLGRSVRGVIRWTIFNGREEGRKEGRKRQSGKHASASASDKQRHIRVQYTHICCIPSQTRGQWPYRPAAIRATNGSCVLRYELTCLVDTCSKNASIHKMLPQIKHVSSIH